MLLGIKNADENELKEIATDPDDVYVFNVQDFNLLTNIVDPLTNNLCNSVKGGGGELYLFIKLQWEKM